jgi:hypothetical protein
VIAAKSIEKAQEGDLAAAQAWGGQKFDLGPTILNGEAAASSASKDVSASRGSID